MKWERWPNRSLLVISERHLVEVLEMFGPLDGRGFHWIEWKQRTKDTWKVQAGTADVKWDQADAERAVEVYLGLEGSMST
jgi:hypothetical protein